MWTWAQLCGREGTGSPSPPFLRKTPEGRPGTRSYEGRCSRHDGQREEHQVWCVLTPASERGAWYGQAHVPGNWLCHAVWWEPGPVLIQSPGKKRWPWRQQWTGGGFAGAVLLGCQSRPAVSVHPGGCHRAPPTGADGTDSSFSRRWRLEVCGPGAVAASLPGLQTAACPVSSQHGEGAPVSLPLQ